MMTDPISDHFIESIKTNLKRAYVKAFLEEVTGPLIYGLGNFEVYEDESGDWQIRPAEGWEPPELLGIFNVEEEAP